MWGMIITGVLTAIGIVASTARGMHADNLISEKELREIEARSKAFTEFINFKRYHLEREYELRIFMITSLQEQFRDIMSLFDKIMLIDDNSPKLEILDRKLNVVLEYYKNFMQITSDQIKNNDFHISEINNFNFDKLTEIGTKHKNVNYANSINYLPLSSKQNF
ncbi:MAG: hypothetical protein PHR06_10065 [Candidatus Cloacimonetes bacterium]|nr:hypothetical protein [Candidatus Cloacimonadota bacterium]